MRAPTLFSYLPAEAAASLCKLAEEEKKKPHALWSALKAPVGLGLGTAGGLAASYGGSKLYKHVTGKKVPLGVLAAAPVLGAGLGLAYHLAQAHQMEEFRRAAEGPHHKS